MAEIRLLKAEEIECRVGIINERGLSLLLFKDARVDQKLLDETFTPMGWKRLHQEIGGNLYCTVSVWDEGKKQWIEKQDVGLMGNIGKEKSQASDSFKRACFNWGIGRELYTAPFIWIPADKAGIYVKDIENGKKKYCTNEQFRVASIDYTREREIRVLFIEDSRSHIVYTYSAKMPGECSGVQEQKPKEAGQDALQGKKSEKTGLGTRQMNALQKEMERTGVALETVLKRYQIVDVGQMTQQMYKDAITGLKRSKDASAA